MTFSYVIYNTYWLGVYFIHGKLIQRRQAVYTKDSLISIVGVMCGFDDYNFQNNLLNDAQRENERETQRIKYKDWSPPARISFYNFDP